MNLSDLAAKLAEKENLTRSESKAAIKLIFRLLGDAMKKRDRIEIRGFGSFVLRDYKIYIGRNPKTGEKFEVRPKGSTYFKAGKELKKPLNGANISGQHSPWTHVPLDEVFLKASVKTTIESLLPPTMSSSPFLIIQN